MLSLTAATRLFLMAWVTHAIQSSPEGRFSTPVGRKHGEEFSDSIAAGLGIPS